LTNEWFRLLEALDAGAISVVVRQHPVYNSLPNGNPIVGGGGEG